MKTFTVKGSFKNGAFTERFTKEEVVAESAKLALEWVYAQFGSKNRCKRRQMKIDEVRETK